MLASAPARSLNHIRSIMGIPDSIFPEGALIVRLSTGVGVAQPLIPADVTDERLAFVMRAILGMWTASAQVHRVPALRTDWLIINAKIALAMLLK